nr:gp1 [Camellia sinensis badnavirus]
MSERWERSIEEWYEKSHTANLSYLDLAQKLKPSHSEIAHNLAVIYDKNCLSSRVTIKNYKTVSEQLTNLDLKVSKLERKLKSLEKDLSSLSSFLVENKPLTKTEVKTLVEEISQQPKLVEQQTVLLTKQLQEKIDKVEVILHQVKGLLG